MTGSRVNSWALSIAGDVPPPLQIPQPSREVHKHPNAHDQVNVSIPPFNGRFKPALYIEREFDIKIYLLPIISMNIKRLRLRLVLSLVMLWFGGVNIVGYTLIIYLLLGMI